MKGNSAAINYDLLAGKLQKEIQLLKKKVDTYSLARLAIFILAIAGIYLFFDYGLYSVVFILLVTIVGFLLLIKKQVALQELLNFKRVRYQLVRNEIDLLSSKGENIYNNGKEFESSKHPYTDDLDIFGENSVFEYINRGASKKSQSILASFLKHAATKTEIINRQEAIQELASLPNECLDYRARLFPLDNQELDKVSDFFGYDLDHYLEFINSKKLQIYLRAVPFISLLLIVVAIFLKGLWWNFFGLFLMGNMGFYFIYKSRIDIIHERIGKASDVLKNYAINLEWIEKSIWKSSLLKDRLEELRNEVPVYTQITILNKVITNLNYRFNIIIAVFLNLLFQWDLKQVMKLAHWNKHYNKNVLKGFYLVAELETYISLAVLDNNHSDWIYPHVNDEFGLSTTEIGHPLIRKESRVDNDFTLNAYPTSDVITGSNMAGKSTFLRTVGVNMVLCFMGAKVCAKTFNSSIFHLYTFMRIKDSLAESTSTFKAEIDRLKMILDETSKDKNAFILIDEMLRGTNSKDKYLGSKAFIERMLKQETPGFIATHDLQIADLEKDNPQTVRNYHFDISVRNGEMVFDYKIKEGPCKTFNAAILLEKIGLAVREG
ncbi:DNA mismatch repair protein MutS domain protein [Pseudopedobacter saltans DSM 12145]|uniref:DNA mismatch repair protein MutS domain protein n=1 Tax=Pseudopedobacter saltans (strain ATCC 51119 / DSM 12145 / JCM 21818 / CCUG 39354 / LMG 10337 / NBRC 100064 / NCIMB 13643) TaxID=762903 RepID=F0SET0_PSESL|nr:DNA mismatch repair protein MutS [Pseudopedobacter saltans]ADY52996.1 DNA mismatch repair protein MutS domain protein [Pseudopedobacter saltans DSM 12145]